MCFYLQLEDDTERSRTPSPVKGKEDKYILTPKIDG